MTLPLISVIIINYNGKSFLRSCVESVLAQTWPYFEVLVVDNASTDGSVDFLTTHFPMVQVISSNENLGFAGGNNLGARHAKGEFIALLNNDAVAAPDWLEKMLTAFEDPQVAVVMAKIYTEGIPTEYYERNGTLNLIGYNIIRVFDDPTKTFYASGCALMYRRDAVGEEPFDADYFLYAEDVYLSWRVRLKGYEVVHVPNAHVNHKGSITAKKRQDIVFYQTRNRILNCLLFYERRTLEKIIPYFIFGFFAQIVAASFTNLASVTSLLKSYFYLLQNRRTIWAKRNIIQQERVASDTELTRIMSCKLTNSTKLFANLINDISRFYCHSVKIPVAESVGRPKPDKSIGMGGS